MNLFEVMLGNTGYIAQELADLLGVNISELKMELNEQIQKGKIGIISVRGYEFYYIRDTRSISK